MALVHGEVLQGCGHARVDREHPHYAVAADDDSVRPTVDRDIPVEGQRAAQEDGGVVREGDRAARGDVGDGLAQGPAPLSSAFVTTMLLGAVLVRAKVTLAAPAVLAVTS